jgi:hypothetical protein
MEHVKYVYAITFNEEHWYMMIFLLYVFVEVTFQSSGK